MIDVEPVAQVIGANAAQLRAAEATPESCRTTPVAVPATEDRTRDRGVAEGCADSAAGPDAAPALG